MKTKQFFIGLFLLLSAHVKSQDILTVSVDKRSDGVSFYAENKANFPVSVQLRLEVENLSSDIQPGEFVVVPPFTRRHRLATLTTVYNGAWRYKYNYIFFYGDVRKNTYDSTYIYELPYSIDSAYRVNQGYFGKFSHQTVRALDFLMPEGTPITAARGGRVANVIQHNSESCGSIDCAKFNNLVLIYHDDGTFAEYLHISQNSATVKIGDVIKAGQVIAKSGNTGFSTTPHLHFAVFRPTVFGVQTLATKFQVGAEALYLTSPYSYKKSMPSSQTKTE